MAVLVTSLVLVAAKVSALADAKVAVKDHAITLVWCHVKQCALMLALLLAVVATTIELSTMFAYLINPLDMNSIETQIIGVIKKKLCVIPDQVEKYTAFYIGKTSDFDERRSAHLDEGYTFVWELVVNGAPATISKLENDVVEYFISDSDYKAYCKNYRVGSAGNPNATILYVAFCMQFAREENALGKQDACLHNDCMPIAEGFPIDLGKNG